MKSKRNMSGRVLLPVVFLLLLAPLVVLAVWRMEGKAPSIESDLEAPAIGKSPRTVTVEIREQGRGLKDIQAHIAQAERDVLLDDVQFEGSMLLSGSGVETHRLDLVLDPAQLKLADGDAILRIQAADYSWRNWWNGNRTVVEIPLTVDSKPPAITTLSHFHYINQGGSGLLVYRLDEPCPRHGVLVGEHFYPGHPRSADEPLTMLAFFAVGYDQSADIAIRALAADRAGNEARAGFSYSIRPKRFKKDVLNISDRFITQNMRPLLEAAGEVPTDPKDIFLAVNRDMRQQNGETLAALAGRATPTMAWEGVFMRLPKSANRAQFADHRAYKYRGAIIDRQVHLGVDLASLQQASVPAANHGQVVFADNVGIYGNTVVIEHGFGLFSLYSHLSSIQVTVDQRVAKGDIIGRTGVTGLALGDHLHFGMMVHDTLVNPIEWWDAHWIRDNITTKLNPAS